MISASFGNSKITSTSLTKSTYKGSTPVTCLTFRQITWPLKASGAIHSIPHPPFNCTLSNNANSLVSVGTNSLGSRGLSHDSDHSLFPSLPLTGMVFELLAMAVTLFADSSKEIQFYISPKQVLKSLLQSLFNMHRLQHVYYNFTTVVKKRKKAATRSCR